MKYLSPEMLGLAGLIGGLLVGSYLATITMRWPSGEGAAWGRSRCDGCDRRLAWFELVPVASYVILQGKCRTCGNRIDPVHPGMELACGMVGAMLAFLGQPFWAVLAWLLVALAVLDWKYLWLPDRLTNPLAVVAIAVPPMSDGESILARLLAGLVATGILWLLAHSYRAARGRQGLGLGDAKLLGALALWAGPHGIPMILLVACGLGLLDAGLRTKARKRDYAIELPLGSYLAVTAVGFMVWTAALHGSGLA